MSLTRRAWLLLGAVLVAGLGLAWAVHLQLTRQALQEAQRDRNADAAWALALALSSSAGDESQMRLTAARAFDLGPVRRLRVVGVDGREIFAGERVEPSTLALRGFGGGAAGTAAPGTAVVSNGAQPVARVEWQAVSASAAEAWWSGAARMGAVLLLAGVAAAAAMAGALNPWRRAVDSVVAQAEALGERRFVIAPPQRVPELQRLARGMNALARRLQRSLDEQAVQIDTLRAQAHGDPLTGLANRRIFVAELDAALRGAGPRGAGLLIVRVCALQAMNQRIGHDAADRLLAAVAQVLQSYPARVRGARAGRLNGSDFALYLPVAGITAETADSLAEALRVALAVIDPQADLRLGAAELPPGGEAAGALAAADEALARAESAERFAVAVAAGQGATEALGERTWRARLSAALADGRSRLAETEVRDAQGRLVHLDCTLQLQVDPGGASEPPSHWSAMAQRCGLAAVADLAGIELALRAIAADGRPRALTVMPASLATPGFVADVTRRLALAAGSASALWIEFAEAAAERQPARLREACMVWRATGARVGLSHAAASPQLAARVTDLGLDHVRIAGAFLEGVAGGGAAGELARGMVEVLREMRVQVFAHDVDDPADRAALWAFGFDGAAVAAPGTVAG